MYWTVADQADFHRYLEECGQDFEAIARRIGTKTAAMVEKHYKLLAANGGLDIQERAYRGMTDGVQTPPPLPKRSGHDQHAAYATVENPDFSKSDSDMTNSSTFSAMARPKRHSIHETPTAKSSRRRSGDGGVPLGQRSLASLTSGVSDYAHISR